MAHATPRRASIKHDIISRILTTSSGVPVTSKKFKLYGLEQERCAARPV